MTNVFENSNILDILRDKIAGKSAKHSQIQDTTSKGTNKCSTNRYK